MNNRRRGPESILLPRVLVVSLLVTAGVLSWGAPTARAASTVVIKGSDTMFILNQELVAEYRLTFPETRFDVEGRGTSTGIAALLNGTTDIAACSRAMTDEEREAFKARTGAQPTEIVIALDGIGVYVHNNNPITQLTLDQLSRILRGEITNWSHVGGFNRPIHIYNRDKQSGTRAYMQSHVLKDAPFSSNARDVSSTALLTSIVARNLNAIGYGGIAYAEGTHILRLAAKEDEPGLWPSRENVSGGKYPLSRPLYYYLNPNAIDADVQPFVDWVLDARGQRIVTFVGFYPAPEAEPEEPASVPEEAPAPVVNHTPILVTPETMEQQGFQLEMVLDREASLESGRVTVTLRFQPAGKTIDRIRTLNAHLGEEAEIPLALQDDLSVQVALSENLLNKTVIHLAEEGAPENGAVFVVPLEAFLRAE